MTMAAAAARTGNPPGPRDLPLIGQLPAFGRNGPEFLLRTAREYGDIVCFNLGPKRVYVLTHPDLIKEVLVTRQHDFAKSRMLQRAKMLLGDGLLTSEPPLHTRQRRLVQPVFHTDRLAAYGRVMSQYAVGRRERWREGELLDVDREMRKLTLAIVARTLFDADVEAETDEIGEALTQLLELLRMLWLPFSEILEKLPVPSTRRFKKARDRLDATIYRIISQRRASGADKGDVLSMLLLALDEAGTGGMTDEQVRDEALTIFLAGQESTAVALTWTWYVVSQHPEVEARLHAELDEVLDGRAPSVDDLPQLRYTDMVFAEAMRLYPPAWSIGRTALKPFEVLGYTIPPGSLVLTPPYVVHRDPRWFAEPEHFDPERWTAEEKVKRPKFSYFPFGGGARVCIGDRFAWMEGVLLLAAIAQKWRFELLPGHPVAYRAVITLRARYGMRMIARAR